MSVQDANARRQWAEDDEERRLRQSQRRLRVVEEPPPRRPAPALIDDGSVPARRTVRINGQSPAPRRRQEPVGGLAGRPDRPARWAFGLGLFMILMAVVTGDPSA